MVCGLPAALSAIERAPVRGPVFVGVKLTPMTQFAPGATGLPHVLVCAKSAAFTPVIIKLPIVRGPVPVFVRMTVCRALVVPTV